MRKPKFIIGQPVEFKNDRIVGSEDGSRLENVEGMYITLDYKSGRSGVITGIFEDYKEAENFKDALNTGVAIDPSAIYYSVQDGLTPKYMVPEYDLEGVVDLKAKVEEKLQKAQESKEFKDVGPRVGGTKKEKMAYKMILTSDLNEIEKSEVLARDLVKKDKVYPKVDVAKEQEKGVSTGAAYLKVKLREAFPSQPADSKEKRKVYVGYVELLIKQFADVLTIDQFNKARYTFADNSLSNIIYTLLSPEMQEKFNESKLNMDRHLDLLIKKKEQLEVEKLELFEKYKEASQWNKEYFSVDGTKHPDYNQKINEIQNISEKIQYLKAGITEIEVDAITELTGGKTVSSGYRDKKYIGQALIKELFGSRYYNFLYKYGDSVYKTYEDAQDFEAITEEESAKILEKYNVPNKARLAEMEANVKLLQSRPSLQELQEYFSKNSRGSTGYYRSLFPVNFRKEYVYWEDVKNNAPMAEIYTNRHLNRLISDVENLKKSIEDYNKKYQPKESDWSWSGIKKRAADGEKAQKSELTINKYPPLDHIKRTGGYRITDEDVTVESIVTNFNFKSVTLGNYVKDKEAREHIRHFLGAMADLGDILNMDIKHLNEFLGLSLWFGAGGYGKAGAYYKMNGVVINLTKTNGDGAVAHEYAHYLDNAFAVKFGLNYGGTPQDKAFMSNMKKSGYGYTNKLANINVNDDLTAIFRYIYERKLPLSYSKVIDGKDIIASEVNKQVKIKEVIPSQNVRSYRLVLKGENIDEVLSNFFNSYPSFRMHENLSKRDRDILGFIINKFGYKEYEIEFDTRTTAFYANSSKMSSDYWTRPWELFARAFETYIYDKLEKAGRTNNYLVSGAYFDRPEGVYPQGAEREILYDLYDSFFKAAKYAYEIPDYQSWTSERVDEYIDLSKNSKGEEDTVAAVVSNAETGETLEIVDDKAKEKMKERLKRLAEYLSEPEKFEKGGIIFGQLVQHIKNKS